MLKITRQVTLLLLAGALSFPAYSYATQATEVLVPEVTQEKVTGTVEDALGPVIGASVMVKGTTNGVITDLEGKFSLNDVKKGDIIVIKKKVKDGDYIIKRVIGQGGDTIKIQNNKVYVNGEVLDEPYINEPMNKNENITVTIPEGYLFVMGDNRNNSLDSRSSEIGLIDVEKEVVGKAIFSLSSFSKIY